MQNKELTHKIIGCAMKVHSTLGNGFPSAAIGLPTARQEVIYQRALAIEMASQGLSFQREMEMSVYYEGEQIGTRRVDFFVEGEVMVELKAIIKLEEVHLAQAMNYCQAYNLPIGLLINFGAKSLQFKRVYNVNHPDNKKTSKSGLQRLKDDGMNTNHQNQILQSNNPKNPNSDNGGAA